MTESGKERTVSSSGKFCMVQQSVRWCLSQMIVNSGQSKAVIVLYVRTALIKRKKTVNISLSCSVLVDIVAECL